MTVTDLLGTFVVGSVFGLALAGPPGPMNALIAEESVLRGWVAGFTAGLGAMSADFVFFVLSLAGVVAFLENAVLVRGAMVLVGGLVMLYFAYGAATGARQSFTGEGVDTGVESDGPADGHDIAGDISTGGETESATRLDSDGTRGFTKAFVLALTNPYQILFWLTVGVGLLEPGRIDVLSYLPVVGADLAGTLVVQTGTPVLLVGLFGGIVVWIVGFPAVLVGVGRRVDAFVPAVAIGSAVVLAGFGVTFLWDGLRTLLG